MPLSMQERGAGLFKCREAPPLLQINTSLPIGKESPVPGLTKQSPYLEFISVRSTNILSYSDNICFILDLFMIPCLFILIPFWMDGEILQNSWRSNTWQGKSVISGPSLFLPCVIFHTAKPCRCSFANLLMRKEMRHQKTGQHQGNYSEHLWCCPKLPSTKH